ncbi:Ig-like domain-containing protein [Pseudomonas fluorescens]|uniref:Ig-like domain-containing protein n=1 Tax=Pseudomonas fluorescens TaxID=294 RepID=UPI001A9CBEAE|nr:Ig-like domain-containing protein [Pseudomonas fluorescens]QTD34903.1 Ig-like domain-containing protein [Pseudomonas fluorescens]
MLTHSPLLFPDLDQPVTLALRPMQISGAVTPVEDADVGINIVVVEESVSGVLCVIAAYLAMLEGDENVVYWDDIPVFTRTVETGEKDKHLFFYLPKALFTPGLHRCFYELTRFGASRPDDPSVVSLFFVKLTSPGGRDKEPHLPDGHSELHIAQLPQEIIDQGVIDAEWAKKGVPLTVRAYPEIRVRDTILMRWGSHTLALHLVTQPQAEGKDPIVIVATQEDILAGGDSAALEIKYDPHDEVLNWSSRHSKRTRIAVDAGAWRLAAPIIKESINGIITIIDLNKEDVTVQVNIQGSDFALNDSVKMTWIGTPFTGKPLIHTETKPVGNIPSVMEFDVPYAQVRAIAMGRADASYVLTKADGSKPLSSKREFADVVGDVSMPYAPRIAQVMGDILEPDNSYATVLIEYLNIANGDLVAGHWIGEKSNGQAYVHEFTHTVSDSEAKEGFFAVYVDKEHISVLDKGKLNLWYTVSNDKPELYGVSDSEHLLVKVQAITATLPRPEVEEADKKPDVLDPSKVFDVVHILIENPPTLKDDFVTWYWQAPDQFGSICDGVPITSLSAGKSLRFRVPEEYVTRSIGQYVKVRYVLRRPSTQRYEYSATLILLIGELVGELLAPKVIQAPDDILNPKDGLNGVDVRVSYENMKSGLDTINLSWIGTPGAGTSTDLELPGDDSGTVTFRIAGSVIGADLDRRVSVSYGVTRYGFTTPSESLDLYVSNFEDPENDWPRPQVPLATNDVLDLMMFIGDARALVLKWPFIALKQRLWLRLEGKTATGSDYIIRMLDGVEITSAQFGSGLNEVLLRSELMKLGHSTPATVICNVAFDGSPKEDEAIGFPPYRLTVRTRYDWVTPVITGVTDARGDVPEGEKTRYKEVTVKGTATRDETVELFDAVSTSLGTAPVDAKGEWTRIISGLTEKTYSITAKALYDADPVTSNPRTFEVKFAETPEINTVTDSRGPVTPGSITYDNSVVIEGSATPNERIQLQESTAPVIDLPVDADGFWRHTLSGLTAKSYVLNAKALYDIQPPLSPPYRFRVEQAVTPTISRVVDAKGDVEPGGTTYYKSVTLHGQASPDEKITLLDGVIPINIVDVKPSGGWDFDYNNLSLKTYNLRAKAEYGSEPVSAPPRVFTVAAFISPTITSVTDSRGPVNPGGTTYDSTVSLLGQATPKEQIQIYNKGTAIGTPVTVGADRQWRSTVTGLGVTSHSLSAKALYPVDPVESQPFNFNVDAHTPVTITSVHDGISELQNGAETKRTSVTLRGNVTPDHQVQIYDNNSPKHTVRATDNVWNTTLGVELGGHSITAKAVSTGQSTVARWFTVISPIPPLNFNTSPVTLSGKTYLIPSYPNLLPAFGPGTSVQHQASGGQPGYTYRSSNQQVAVVDQTGLVTVRWRGSAIISVTDAANQSLSYTVHVTGVIHCVYIGKGNYLNMQSAGTAINVLLPTLGQLREIYNLYGNRWPLGNGYCWSTDRAASLPFLRLYMKDLVTGTEAHVQHYGTAIGMGIR